ncbi:MAG: cation transporter [Thermoplasmata archaeon]|nr:MAG: cation transporter [Thermoplasmata archaeon]
MQRTIASLGYYAGWLSVIVNISVFFIKYWAGVSTSSVAMVADAWHTLSDVLTSAVVIVGFWIASKPADREHPFGHGRAEAIGAIIIGTLLVVVGVTFFRESVFRLQVHEKVMFSRLSIIIFSATIFVKEALAQVSIRIGRKIDSHSLVADGWHHRSDAITSVLIVAGAVAGSSFWWMDGVMGIAISAFILYMAYTILKRVASLLLGEAPDRPFRENISRIVAEVAPQATHVHHLHVHRYGDHTELTFHVMLPSDMRLKEAHAVADSIERAIRRELHIAATVHVDPLDENEREG